MFDLSLEFALNAMFFTDDYIDKQAETKKSQGEQATGFAYTVLNELSKSLWPVIISSIIGFITCLILIIPQKYKDELNEKLISKDIQIQKDGM